MDLQDSSATARPEADAWLDRLRNASALCALIFTGLLFGSGIGLAMSYVPSGAEAFPSVLYLRQQGGLGALLRSLHYQLSSAVVVAAFLMVVFGVLGEEHRARKWEFRLSVVALLLMIGFCFTGYLLPMDQPAYWGTSVRLGIVETVPLVGGIQADMLRGGPTFGAATLPRFYALHGTALPIVLTILVLLGFRDALSRAARTGRERLLAACGLIAAIAWTCAALFQAPLEPRADAADIEYVPRPEWYFLWLFQLGKYAHGIEWVQNALVPFLAVATLMLLPEFSTTRKVRAWGVGAAMVFMLSLAALARYEDRDLPRKPQYEEGLVLKGARDYRVECSGCHGSTGKGDGPDTSKLDTLPKDFTRAAFWDADTMTGMADVIAKGEAPDMPAFGDRLSTEQILAIARHIEANFRPRTTETR
jgi:ubiquinol-cytochrome c reductase cytochrome b subunit